MSDLLTIRVKPLEYAIAMHEGAANLHGGFPNRLAVRREARWKERLEAKGVTGTELGFQCRSWGIWQLLGVVLRELGYRSTAENFCADLDVQLHYMRTEWRRKLRAIPAHSSQEWRLIEAWNKGAGGALKLAGPTDYHRHVMDWLRRAPAPDSDGCVALVTVARKE